MFVGVVSHKYGLLQQKYYDTLTQKKRKYSMHEWNVSFIRALLNMAHSIWKFRCEHQQESGNAIMQQQLSSMARELKLYIRDNQWMIRREDVGLINKSKAFFEKGGVPQLQGWVERIQLSMAMVQYHDSKLRQDIRKWLHLQENPIGKTIKWRNEGKVVKRNFAQTTMMIYMRKEMYNTEISLNNGLGIHNANGVPERVVDDGQKYEEVEDSLQTEH